MDGTIAFKYKDIDANGREIGFLSKKGALTSDKLSFGANAIPCLAILSVKRLKNRLMVVVNASDGGNRPVVFAVTSGNTGKLHAALIVLISHGQAGIHKQALEAAGRGMEFRVQTCPHCGAAIDLSSLARTEQMYCRFCDTVVTLGPEAPPDEKLYHFCGQCNLYGQPKLFTIIYVYFLVVVYGYQYQTVHMCNSCMRPRAWKMLGINLLFVIGTPMAVVQLIRAYFGGSTFSTHFAGLDKSNSLLKGNRFEQAIHEYEAIEQRMMKCAGVRYNYAVALLKAGRSAEAVKKLEQTLADCSNFAPSFHLLCQQYEKLGRVNERKALRAIWLDEPLAAAQPPALPAGAS